ncbi:MAG: lysylphosphatidylglycerol synthase transmembrane domain-containing protein [Anaerolineae bacterium]
MIVNAAAKRRWANLLKVAVTLGLLVVVVLTVDLRSVVQVLALARWGDFAVALLLYQLGLVVRAYRWQALLEARGAHVPLLTLLDLYYVGTFFNNFLPSGFGGDVVKMYELARHGADGETAVSTVLADRVIGLVVLLGMALVALPFTWRLVPGSVILALLALIVGTVVALTLFLNRRLVEGVARRVALFGKVLAHPKVSAFYASCRSYDRRSLLRSSLASLLFNVLLILTQVGLARAAGVSLGIGYFFLFVPIISSVLMLPISISGFGVREGAYVVLFGQAGVPADQAVAISLLFYGANLLTGVVGGVLYILRGARGYREAAP